MNGEAGQAVHTVAVRAEHGAGARRRAVLEIVAFVEDQHVEHVTFDLRSPFARHFVGQQQNVGAALKPQA